MSHSLLPNGFEDSIDPAAGREGAAVEQLVSGFERLGYRRVRPPLLEFEQTLTAGPGAQTADLLFRVPDPITNRMLAARADMTVQVARLAQTRLAQVKRPLRLCYHGQVLRTQGEELRPNRQLTQVGLEIIGIDPKAGDMIAADLEVLRAIRLGLDCWNLGAALVDVTLPDFLPALADELGLKEADRSALSTALDARDAAALTALVTDPQAQARVIALLTLPTAAGDALEALAALFPSAAVARALAPAQSLVEHQQSVLGTGLSLTLDPTERRGTPYHHGLGYNLYLDGHLIGRGGRYRLDDGRLATGCTLYMDTLGGLLPVAASAPKRVAVPLDCPADQLTALQADGTQTLLVGTDSARARAAGATNIFINGKIEDLN